MDDAAGYRHASSIQNLPGPHLQPPNDVPGRSHSMPVGDFRDPLPKDDSGDEVVLGEEAHRSITLPSHSAQELMVLFPSQDESGFEPGFGLPFRRRRRSKSARQRDQVLSELAERLRSNNFEFVAEREAAAAREAVITSPELFENVFSPEESAIIFDWDDTLFPTWYVTEVVNPCLEDVHCDQLPADSPFAQCLSSQAQAVSDILRCACVCGRVAIVTLAQHPWALNSAAKYLPGLDLPGLLEELDIPVIYARQYLKRYVIQEGTQEGECLWTLAKQAAMTKVLRKLYGREAPWMNVLSIGDSTVERAAIMELMWRSAHEDGSGRLPCCKTIKLVDDPSVEQLHTQLVILTTWMKQLVQHGHDFDFSLDDSDGTIHEQFANSAT